MLLSKYKQLGLILCGVSMVVLSACSQKAPKEEMPAPVAEISAAPMETVDIAPPPAPVIEDTEIPAPIVAATDPVMDEPSTTSSKTGGVGVKYHTVKKGDTVYSLAKKYGTTAAKLMKWNGLKSAKALKVGKKLKVRL
jgi:LysM repeat protein